MIIVRLVLALVGVSAMSVVIVRRISFGSALAAIGLFLPIAVAGLVVLYYVMAAFGNLAGS